MNAAIHCITITDVLYNNKSQISLGPSHLDTTRHVRRVERVETRRDEPSKIWAKLMDEDLGCNLPASLQYLAFQLKTSDARNSRHRASTILYWNAADKLR